MIDVRACVEHLSRAERVLVIGCSGSGKSTLAHALGARLELPYISMDRSFFWLPNWQNRSAKDVRERVTTAVASQRWIMDGTSPGTLDLRLPRTDVVLWLRLPRSLCVARVLLRYLRYRGRPRPEMADGCPEKMDMEFLSYVWNFDRDEAPRVTQGLETFGPRVPVFTFGSRGDVARLLQRLNHDGAV